RFNHGWKGINTDNQKTCRRTRGPRREVSLPRRHLIRVHRSSSVVTWLPTLASSRLCVIRPHRESHAKPPSRKEGCAWAGNPKLEEVASDEPEGQGPTFGC